MKIAIVDDDKEERALLTELICQCCDNNIWNAKLVGFSNGESMFQSFTPGDFNIYFLDIYMAEMTGVEVAKRIRKQDENAIFIFTTSSEEFYREGFDVGALHYLVKPIDYAKVKDAMNRCIKSLGEIARQIEIKVGKNRIKVKLVDIQYIEVLGNACHIHMAKNKIVTYTPLNDLEKLINEKSFLRCHRSFLVNMRAIIQKTSDGLIMENGALVPVPKNSRTSIMKEIDNYNIESMWE
ncbi:response regulator transcription factor [Clostridium sp. PL3]|uniref:Response regulator transcription factor n=1 Tax=Clostridium thailandense TaxID=2794346 RepID=A0A949X3I9_9CLOT|nr:LytTR family DNA-binding domain-containing protein [Clostridium thailandense]MBV7272478.1 response regulator transcription factor [Clostridium thailandense]